MNRRTHVFGPAYLDRILRLDQPLGDSTLMAPLDQSVDGRWRFGEGLELVDPDGRRIVIELPRDWPGPTGVVELSLPIGRGTSTVRRLRAVSWLDDLGGMGSGFAAALGGELVSALGPVDDPTSGKISRLLEQHRIIHHPVRVAGAAADWTLLLSSGEFGDKLAVGFRGCHARVASVAPESLGPCALRVVAALPNPVAAEALLAPGAGVRVFAPAMRNMVDRQHPVLEFTHGIDVLCCNRMEWESLEEREQVAWRVSLLCVTDGPAGCTIRFTHPNGEAGLLRVPAFPRARPPRDTNRAGEAFASELITTLLDGGWAPGVSDESLVRTAAERAAVAAALELDLTDSGFPTPIAIDAALRAGRVD